MTLAKTKVADEAEDRAIKEEEEETEDEGVDSNGADGKEVGRAEKVAGDDRHDANHRSNEQSARFPAARFASEDVLRVKTESGEDENPDWDEENNF